MMLRDASALLNIQIAFMGIVLVVGLFYLWKMMKGLEHKVSKLSASVTKLQDQLEARGAAPAPSIGESAAEDAMAQAFMNEVFGGGPSPAFLHTFAPPKPASVVVMEESGSAPAAEPASAPAAQNPFDIDVDADTASVITTSTISKSKVRKMTAEALRDLCKERGLDTEGTRAVLMERVLATLDD